MHSNFSGSPIISPLWWIDPSDKSALTVDSEFLIGETVLVAPVLEKGGRKRDIYLPQGQWRDEINGGMESGQQWLKDYKVKLDQIPVFTLTTTLT